MPLPFGFRDTIKRPGPANIVFRLTILGKNNTLRPKNSVSAIAAPPSLPPSRHRRRRPSSAGNFYKHQTKFLSYFSTVEVGKNLIRTWVEFGKKMVPRNQGVKKAHFGPVFWSYQQVLEPISHRHRNFGTVFDNIHIYIILPSNT